MPLGAIGTLTPAALVKTIGSEMANTLRVFEAYFGPYPYKHLAITNIPYSYGQGWPTLIYLSALSFLDSTQRHELGIREQTELTDFFRAHESSHQWWGHRVGWKSYHDQWLSEGFAEFSGNLYVQFRQNRKEYLIRLRKDKEALATRDLHSHVYESVGPVWMGLRLASSESPGAYATVIYKKGGYVLHMLRMMMLDPRNPQNAEARFQAMMQDFCRTFENQSASTEDFKAVVEKHMTPSMDLEVNHRMDWFFRQYVYGTGIAQYEFHYQVQDAGEGRVRVTGSVTRSGVPDGWMDILPLYLHRGDTAARLGFVRATQKDNPIEIVLPMKPEKLSLNYNEDILADVKQ
jgi:aminopeptidase N